MDWKDVRLDQFYRCIYRGLYGFALGVAYGEFPVPQSSLPFGAFEKDTADGVVNVLTLVGATPRYASLPIRGSP